MSVKIIPSVMGTTQKELNELYTKLEGVSKELHFDVGDGKFVPSKVNWFNFRLSSKFNFSAHLMVQKPLLWIQKYGHKFDSIIFHPESLKDSTKVIKLIKSKKKKVGLALKPEMKVSFVKELLSDVEYVLVLTVHPGFYGAKYLKGPLSKIGQIKRINPKIKVIVDGGMNPKTINDAVRAGADIVVSGSYVSGSDNPRRAIRELRKSIV